MLSPAGDKPWTLEPTPIADLAEALKQQLIERVMMEFQAQLGAGMPPTGPEIFTRTLELYDDEVGALQEEAAKRARRMEQKIYDQLIEEGFSQAFETFVRDLCTYPLGILKGPVVRKEKRTAWVKGQVQVVDEVIPTWSAVMLLWTINELPLRHRILLSIEIIIRKGRLDACISKRLKRWPG